MAEKLGSKISRLRKDKGLTLDELGRRSGASKGYIWELENRNPPRPSAEKLTAIGAVLGVTADYLLDDGQEEPSSAVANAAFFRRYEGLSDETKEKVRQIVELLAGEPKR
ncbi:MAG: helix-turn-helix domain-containing protein [Gammaproteobacteria bacterium]|nr:helix-turn-helix domain-containing protein [Gammaproteobacteria bacterium]